MCVAVTKLIDVPVISGKHRQTWAHDSRDDGLLMTPDDVITLSCFAAVACLATLAAETARVLSNAHRLV